ncbi:MAG: glycosyltransferase [Solirubrobacteraceae bacterium]
MRICIVYDCLFPWTVGGAERWYRNLAERLAHDGHDVTYLTRLQWGADDAPDLPGVRVLAVSPAEPLYGPDGNRRIGQALRFGRGVLGHLLRHGRGYDVVHTASFPYFSVLAAGLVAPWARFDLVVDWFEVWSRHYWATYLGGLQGRVGYLVQRLCVLVPQRAYCFSRLHRDRLVAEGIRSRPELLAGAYVGSLEPPQPNAAGPIVMFAGRHIREKRAPALVPAIARARRTVPALLGAVYGDGPEHGAVLDAIAAAGLADVVEAPGFVDLAVVEHAMRDALCLVLPSEREGYGMVVVEAASQGTPSVVVRAEDNAAVELVEDGVNGVVADSASPEDLAAAIVRVHAAGDGLRASTCAWFARNARRLSLASSLEQVSARYVARSARS